MLLPSTISGNSPHYSVFSLCYIPTAKFQIVTTGTVCVRNQQDVTQDKHAKIRGFTALILTVMAALIRNLSNLEKLATRNLLGSLMVREAGPE